MKLASLVLVSPSWYAVDMSTRLLLLQVRKQVKQKNRQREQLQQRQSKSGKHTGAKRSRK